MFTKIAYTKTIQEGLLNAYLLSDSFKMYCAFEASTCWKWENHIIILIINIAAMKNEYKVWWVAYYVRLQNAV